MIIIDISGGLGNQMFYYATARSISQKAGRPFVFYSNNRVLRSCDQHKLSLDHLNVKEYEIITDLTPFSKDGNLFCIGSLSTEIEHIVIPQNKKIFFTQYWLSQKYFNIIENDLKKELKVKTPPSVENIEIINKINSVNSVAVHVRLYKESRGLGTYIGDAGSNYYRNAVNIINEKVENPVFFVFCLEIDWCKENFKIDGDVVYVDLNNPAYEELRLMYSCKHVIAARSTFSWWAAFLNENENGIKIVPSSLLLTNDNLACFPPDGSIALNHDYMLNDYISDNY